MRAALGVLLVLSGCLAAANDTLVVGTTTTLQDTDLLDTLLATFTRSTGIPAKAVVGGSGETIEKAKRGDVDVLLTHSPARERELLAQGWTSARTPVMFNLFTVAGPASDPAGVRDATNASDAMARIAAHASPFASRGDQSGTHDKERELWAAADLHPAAFDHAWYFETGAGQGQTLLFAAQRDAYVLVDQGTLAQFHAQAKATGVVDLYHEGRDMRNLYAVSQLDRARVPGIDSARAAAFATWMMSAEGQGIIGAHRINGAPVFTPVTGDPDG